MWCATIREFLLIGASAPLCSQLVRGQNEWMIPFAVFALVFLAGFATMTALGAASHAVVMLLLAFGVMFLISALIAWPFLRRPRP